MTNKEQLEYWRDYAKANARWERSGVISISASINLSLSPVKQSIREVGLEKTILMLDSIYTHDSILAAYIALYRAIGAKAIDWHVNKIWRAKSGGKVLTKEDERSRNKPTTTRSLFGIGFVNQRWIDRIQEIARNSEIGKRILSVTKTIREKIRESLAESMGKFVSPDKIIAQLNKDVGGEFSRKRAEVIVRTETTYISNEAAEHAATELEKELGIRMTKVWIATRDDRTRDAHRAMIGQKPIAKEQKFIVGGVPMDKPGDPAGGLSNIINCRCVVSYLPADDDDLGEWD